MARKRRTILNKKTHYHNFKQNDSSAIPDRIIFTDTESGQDKKDNTIKHFMKIGWTCYSILNRDKTAYSEKWEFHNNVNDFCDYINSKSYDNKVLYLIAHNIFFDLQSSSFFKYMSEKGWKLLFFYDKGLTYLMCIKNGKRKIKILSSTNFFPESLAQIGSALGIEKMKVDFNYTDENYLSAYCKNDVFILKEAVIKYILFVKNNDLGRFSLTRASQSMHAFRHRFMKHKIVIHKDEESILFERKAYIGGRTEAFRLGKLADKKYVTLDINSMYPYVMKYKPMPLKLVDVHQSCPVKELEWLLKKYCIIAEVKLKTNIPAYAFRTKTKIIYPVGTFNTFLCSEGLKYALEHNHIKRVYRIQYYTKEILFDEFIDYFYNMRLKYKEEGNKIYEKTCKIIMNSLYGKFGQKNTSEVIEYVNDPSMYYRIENYYPDLGKYEIETGLMNTIVTTKGEEINDKAFVAIPAHVTEYARFLLWELIDKVGIKNVLYCDTDSLKIKSSKILPLIDYIDNTELGKLKVEAINKNIIINGCKDYICDDEIKLKGIPKSAVKLNNNTYEYDTWLSQKQHLRLNESIYFIVKRMVKVLKRNYDKGIVDKYGVVTPITL